MRRFSVTAARHKSIIVNKNNMNKSNSKISGASDILLDESLEKLPHDMLTVEVIGLQVPEEQTIPYSIKIMFFDEQVLSGAINSKWAKDDVGDEVIAKGTMNYDPSDYEKMCLFADVPMTVTIKPSNTPLVNTSTIDPNNSNLSQESSLTDESQVSTSINVFSCNVDILPMFLGTNYMDVKKRMQPVLTPSVLFAISWDNLPLLTMKLSVDRDPRNEDHHDLLAEANYFKITLVGCFNLSTTIMDLGIFTAATKTPLHNETNNIVVEFDEGYKNPKQISPTSFYPKWEKIRLQENVNAQHSEKFLCTLESINNFENINLKKWFHQVSTCGTAWASFHRTLMFKKTELWLLKFVREFKWPFQLRISAEVDYSLMAFLDLFRLLYPGEDTVRIAVPLQWFDEAVLKEKCDCEIMLELNEWEPSTSSNNRRLSKISEAISKTNSIHQMPTGNDNSAAFVVVEVALRHPIKNVVVPLHISTQEIKKMLEEMESHPCERKCTARGQLTMDWINTVKMAANGLRRISYYGSTDFCTFDRQFSSTRTRVEMVTSFCDEAAIYINNNFVARDFLGSDNTSKELILMAHACLVREASEELLPIDNVSHLDPIIRAARHARHFQDTYHAADLYFQAVTQNPRDANCWRELATCLQDLDHEWADVCLDRSLLLNPRHPLTLLSKGCMIFKKNPDEAEPFFLALLFFQPFWVNGMVAANAYFIERENFKMADAIVECIKNIQAQGLPEQLKLARAWEHELGDWWDSTPLLPGMSLYYDTADLLLRIRGIKLAEVCLAQAVHKNGECSAYFHLLALSCRLNGDIDNALCYIEEAIKKYGGINYLRTLQAECYNVQRNRSASIVSLEKTDTSTCSSFSVLLTILIISSERSRSLLADLLRRQPSAYAWVAFAEEWILASKEEVKEMSPGKRESQALSYAIACATEALRIDKQSGRAWALLARLVKSRSRKNYCTKMATVYGHNWLHECIRSPSPSRQSLCQRVGKAVRECQCKLCNHVIL